jgi:hypothetical protein
MSCWAASNYNVNTGHMLSVIDTLGRTVSFQYTNNFLTSITQTRAGAEYQLIHFTYAPKTLNTNFPNMTYHGPANPSPMLLTEVDFDDGSSYRFDYTT